MLIMLINAENLDFALRQLRDAWLADPQKIGRILRMETSFLDQLIQCHH